jgi:hypothetical protein
MAEVAVVGVEGEVQAAEGAGEFDGQGGFAGAGCSGDGEHEGWKGKTLRG